MQPAPAISVIMPVYNGAVLLGETLDSLWRQSFDDFELLVVDDGSTDGTRDLLAAQADPRLRVILNDRNMGPVAARNRAVAVARGRYLAALDADDLSLPMRFERQVTLLDARPDVVMAAGAGDLLLDGRRRPSVVPRQTTPGLIDWMLGFSNPILWSSVMVRADAVRRLSGFMDPARVYAEDFDFHHRIRRLGAIVRIDEVLIHYRCHSGGISQINRARMAARSAAVLAEANAPYWQDDAADLADIVVRHVMLGDPVADAVTIGRVMAAIRALPMPADADSAALAYAHLDGLRHGLARSSVRGGHAALRDVRRQGGGDLKLAGITGLEWRAVGTLRAAYRRRFELAVRAQRLLPAIAACTVL